MCVVLNERHNHNKNDDDHEKNDKDELSVFYTDASVHDGLIYIKTNESCVSFISTLTKRSQC